MRQAVDKLGVRSEIQVENNVAKETDGANLAPETTGPNAAHGKGANSGCVGCLLMSMGVILGAGLGGILGFMFVDPVAGGPHSGGPDFGPQLGAAIMGMLGGGLLGLMAGVMLGEWAKSRDQS